MFKRSLRQETNCLNCGHQTIERYCPSCGQENLHPKLPIGDLIKESFKQLLDIDGRFYKTLKLQFSKPGIVAKEYTSGKRKMFTHPIRLFFVFGAIFLISFNLVTDVTEFAYEQAYLEADKKGISLDSPAFQELMAVYRNTYGPMFNSMVYLIIFSIPLYALFLKIFLRSKNKYYYVDYVIYALYNYIIYFIPITFILIFYYFLDSDNPKDNKWGLLLFLTIIFTHGAASAKRFLEYNWVKSILAGLFQTIFLIISVLVAIFTVMIFLFIINYIPMHSTFEIS